MNPIDKIRHHSEALLNELTNLSVYVGNIEVMGKEVAEKQVSLTGREKRVAEREGSVLNATHANEEAKRQYEADKQALETKQDKLQGEWTRMTEERERLDKEKEEFAKEKLRLQNALSGLQEREVQVAEKAKENDTTDEMLRKKQEALNELNTKLKIKQEKTEQKAEKIDQIYSELG